MSYSYTNTEAITFTVTHARYLSAKVATDLKRLQRLYGKPSDTQIIDFEGEITELLKHGFLKIIYYGFQKDGEWIEPTLIYTADELSSDLNNDPGKIYPGKNIEGAVFCSFLEYSNSWNLLRDEEKNAFKNNLPIKRVNGELATISGYLDNDLTYSSGGKSLSRTSVRSW